MFIKKICANDFNLGYIGWRYYNKIKNKIVEQELNKSSLFLSLFFSFFIVVVCAQGLNLTYQSIKATQEHKKLFNQRVYFLEEKVQMNNYFSSLV